MMGKRIEKKYDGDNAENEDNGLEAAAHNQLH